MDLESSQKINHFVNVIHQSAQIKQGKASPLEMFIITYEFLALCYFLHRFDCHGPLTRPNLVRFTFTFMFTNEQEMIDSRCRGFETRFLFCIKIVR